MIDKSTFLVKLDKLADVVKKYSLESVWNEKIALAKDRIENYGSKVVFVGRFSAGKSALLNALTGSDNLLENQGPETAIATELYYGEQDKLELVDNAGVVTENSIQNIGNINTDQYKYAKCFFPSKFLKEHGDLVFVDMPGFDSSLKNHNKAIMNYIGDASVYVLIVDVEDGTLHSTAIKFLNEVCAYYANVMVVINKCDKKLPNDIEAIADLIQEQVDEAMERKVPLVATSKFDGNLVKKFEDAIEKIDMQAIFEGKADAIVQSLQQQIILSLETVKASITYSKDQLEKAKRDCDYQKSRIEDVFRKEKDKLHNSLFSESLPNIVDAVKQTLLNNADELTDAVLCGKDSFSRQINELIRPILMEKMNYEIEKSFHSFVATVDFSDGNGINSDKIAEECQKTLFRIRNMADKYRQYGKSFGDIRKEAGNVKAILSVLAIVSDVINPILEVIIIFLPDVISFVKDWLNQRRIEEFRSRMRSQIIPSIVKKLEEALRTHLEEVEANMLAELTKKMHEDIASQENTLEAIKQKSQQEKQEILSRIDGLNSDIQAISNL